MSHTDLTIQTQSSHFTKKWESFLIEVDVKECTKPSEFNFTGFSFLSTGLSECKVQTNFIKKVIDQDYERQEDGSVIIDGQILVNYDFYHRHTGMIKSIEGIDEKVHLPLSSVLSVETCVDATVILKKKGPYFFLEIEVNNTEFKSMNAASHPFTLKVNASDNLTGCFFISPVRRLNLPMDCIFKSSLLNLQKFADQHIFLDDLKIPLLWELMDNLPLESNTYCLPHDNIS